MKTHQIVLALTIAIGLSATLGACTSRDEPKVIGETYTASPDAPGQRGPRGTSPIVAWIDTGKRFSITAYGSSTCPVAPTNITGATNSIELELTMLGGSICTADIKRDTYALDVPSGVDTSDSVTVTVVDDDGTKTVLTLPI